MKTTTRRRLSLSTLRRLRDLIITRIAERSARWTFERGDGSRFDNATFGDGEGCWLTATLRETPDESTRTLLVRITLNVKSPEAWHRASEVFVKAIVEGETEFKVIERGQADGYGGWRGWVRRGVDCCSVWLGENRPDCHSYDNVGALLDGEYLRVQAALQAAATARPVPGYPFTRQPEWFTKATADLRTGRAVTLTPSGFGVGYRFTTRRISRFDGRAKVELEQALGVAPLYVETLDCD